VKNSPGRLPIVSQEEKNDSQEEKKVSLTYSHLLIPSPDEEKVFGLNEAPQRFKKYSLEGPLLKTLPPNSSREGPIDSSGREGAISPMRKSRDANF